MAIDPYAPCPCGSGKKLKFCCSDLASEIQKIEKLISGDQPHAALRFVEQLLEKQPERASLLDLRASIELALEEFDAARDTIQRYLTLHPENASAYGQAAIMAAAKGETVAAVGALQAALERAEEGAMPQRVYEAIGAVGHALLVAGDLFAARGHLSFYAQLSPEEDNLGAELLVRLNLQGRPPLLLRDTPRLREAPASAGAWKGPFEEATMRALTGLWQRAEADYVTLLEDTAVGEVPEVVYNLALVRGWLGDTPRLADGLRAYARLDVPWDDAVEAHALADLLVPGDDEPMVETQQRLYVIADEDATLEKFLSDRRVHAVDLQNYEYEDENGKPRHAFLVLDRPLPSTGVGMQIDDVPSVLGMAAFYGKRTDRPAQLALTSDRDGSLERAMEVIDAIAGEPWGDPTESRVVGESPAAEKALSWRWRLPDDTPVETRRDLLALRKRRGLTEQWPQLSLGCLGGKTPEEAAQDPALRVALAAAIMNLEHSSSDPADVDLVAQLREKLQLPPASPIAAADVDLMTLPLARIARLDVKQASVKELQLLLNRVISTGSSLTVLDVATELVERAQRDAQDEEGAETIDLAQLYRLLARLTHDPAKSVEWIEKGRRLAEETGKSAAAWALLDLQIQLQNRDAEGVQRALQELENRHVSEPGVAESIYKLLEAAGLGPMMEGGAPAAAPAVEESQTPAPSVIWTPDAAAPAEGQDERPAIWTP